MIKKSTLKIGQTFRKQIALTYVDTSTPVNLTGCEAYCQMRTVPGGTLLAEADCGVDEALGKITVTFSAEDTANIPEGTYGYDIWITSEGDKVPLYTEQVAVVKSYTEVEQL